jgi:uncharacterized membrane protein YeaQ/YmgE (transglycosylase-associated protein family)
MQVFGCVGFFCFLAGSLLKGDVMLMGIICWIVLGLVAGFIANKIDNGRGEGIPQDIVLGIVGALVGGWLFNAFGTAGVTGFNLWSIFVAVVGAVVILVIWHAVRDRVSRA